MAVVETERHGQILVVRMNRPERLNALSHEMRTQLAETWTEFRRDNELEVAIFTGAGRAFCAGEDMKESLQHGSPGGRRSAVEDPFMSGALEKPVIAAVNGYAMGGGFMLVERTDLRVAARGAVFEVSEAKRWLLGGYNHGHIANLPYPIAMEMALGFRFTAERFYEIGFLNRLVDADQLIPSALAMAEHLLTLPPASRVNTVHMMRQMRPVPSAEQQRLAAALHEHGAKSDLIEVAVRLCRKTTAPLQRLGRPRRPLPAAFSRRLKRLTPPKFLTYVGPVIARSRRRRSNLVPGNLAVFGISMGTSNCVERCGDDLLPTPAAWRRARRRQDRCAPPAAVACGQS